MAECGRIWGVSRMFRCLRRAPTGLDFLGLRGYILEWSNEMSARIGIISTKIVVASERLLDLIHQSGVGMVDRCR